MMVNQTLHKKVQQLNVDQDLMLNNMTLVQLFVKG